MTENTEKNDSTGQNNQFKEQLGGFFYELFRIVGMALPAYSHERFRSTGERMVLLIEQIAKHKAIQVITTLQKAVSTGFNKTESELNNLQTITLSHTTLIGELVAGQKHIAEVVGNLEQRVKEIERQITRRWGVIDKSKKEVQPPSERLGQ